MTPTVDSILNTTVDVGGAVDAVITGLGGIVATVVVAYAGFKAVKMALKWFGWIRG